MTRIRAVVVLMSMMLALLLGSLNARAQTSDEPAVSPPSARRGYAYPIAWILPLVFLVGVGAVGRALTRDLRGTR